MGFKVIFIIHQSNGVMNNDDVSSHHFASCNKFLSSYDWSIDQYNCYNFIPLWEGFLDLLHSWSILDRIFYGAANLIFPDFLVLLTFCFDYLHYRFARCNFVFVLHLMLSEISWCSYSAEFKSVFVSTKKLRCINVQSH